MSSPNRFLFATCQLGAENALKQEALSQSAAMRLAFSRPGFLTFKLPDDSGWPTEWNSVFARVAGWSLGKIQSDDPAVIAQEAWRCYGDRPVRRIHVWARDAAPLEGADASASEPTELDSVRRALVESCPKADALARGAAAPKTPGRPGDFVLDCIRVAPNEWWIGQHRVADELSRWTGGILPLTLPPDAVSRAWLKMEEALRWSDLPIPSDARFAEIGSAPGGASQALLARGYSVLGVDPAAMHETVLAHPNFTHLRRRANQASYREFRKIRWLTADMNVAPNYTLEVIASIVNHAEINVRGMLLTLKLFDWKLAAEIPHYLAAIRSWGFNEIRARQLANNRQEICVAALKRPFHRKA